MSVFLDNHGALVALWYLHMYLWGVWLTSIS